MAEGRARTLTMPMGGGSPTRESEKGGGALRTAGFPFSTPLMAGRKQGAEGALGVEKLWDHLPRLVSSDWGCFRLLSNRTIEMER